MVSFSFRRRTVDRISVGFAGVLTLSAVNAGCSIHPVQQDVTGVPPVEIIHHIRCETRLAIQDKAIDMLRHYRKGAYKPSLDLADKLESQRGEPWPRGTSVLTTSEEVEFYRRYIRTGIAYDFTLDITEENKASLLADPVQLVTNGTVGIGVNASSDFTRNNARRFILSDTFSKALEDPKLRCSGDRPTNFAYPIAGRIGLRELISTFVDLNEDKNLQALESGNPRIFADTMTFTTTLTGSISPHVEIAPISSKWGVAGPAALSAYGQRVDKHMVIIGLSMDVAKEERISAAPFVSAAGGRSALQKSKGVAPTEQSALDAVRQAKVDAYLEKAAR
jgi:hypothetical protein